MIQYFLGKSEFNLVYTLVVKSVGFKICSSEFREGETVIFPPAIIDLSLSPFFCLSEVDNHLASCRKILEIACSKTEPSVITPSKSYRSFEDGFLLRDFCDELYAVRLKSGSAYNQTTIVDQLIQICISKFY